MTTRFSLCRSSIAGLLGALTLVAAIGGCGRSGLRGGVRPGDGGQPEDDGSVPIDDGGIGVVERPAERPIERPTDARTDLVIPDVPLPRDLLPDIRPDGGTDMPPGAVLIGIDITPALGFATVGTSATFTATGRYSDFTTQNLTALAAWSSSNLSVATMTANVAQGVGAGSATIRATYLGVTGAAALTVSTLRLVSITVEPIAAKLTRGGTLSYRATGIYEGGSKVDITSSVSWTSSNTAVATISGSGFATAASAGTTSITATLMGITGSTTLEVTAATLVSIEVTPANPVLPLPAKQQFTATGIFSDSTTSDLTTAVTWESSNAGVVAVSNDAGSKGLATTVAAGTATITARMGPISGTSTVMVSPARLVSIAVTPASASLPRGTTQAFRATGTYSDGSVADLTTSVVWTTTDGAVASVSNAIGTQGVATALGVGTTDVVATLAGITGSAKVTVTSASLVSLAVAPKAASVPIGNRVGFTATATYSDMTTRDVTDVTAWSVSDTSVAGISVTPPTAGQLTGLKVGSVTVTGSFGGMSDTAKADVTSAVLDSIAVRPSPGMVTVGLRLQFSATGSYSDGTTLDITNDVTWSSTSPFVASISNVFGTRGLATGLSSGTTTIRATLSGRTGMATLTVVAAALKGIQVEPIAPTRRVGERVTFVAIRIFESGPPSPVFSGVTWSAAPGSVASITSSGSATCLGAGAATITATYMGFSDSTTLTCGMPMLVGLNIAPVIANIVAGGLQFFSATAVFSDASTQNVTTTATWTSSNPAVASVMTGLARGITPGSVSITASYMGFSASAALTVRVDRIVKVEVVPSSLTLKVGQMPYQLRAIATLESGLIQDVTFGAAWSSSDTSVAEVGVLINRGMVTAIKAGATTITAGFMGFTGTAMVTVTAPVLTGIEVSPAGAKVFVGQSLQYNATALFSDSTSLNVTNTAVWSSSDPMVAGVSNGPFFPPRGSATGVKEGTTMITATYMGKSGSVTLTVVTPKLVSVSVSPVSEVLHVGESQQYQAVGLFEGGSSADITNLAFWTSSNGSVASVVANRGFVTAQGGGKVTITASFMGQSGSGALTVTAAPLTSVRVVPTSAMLNVGQTQQFQAEAVYGDGAVKNVTFLSTWASTNAALHVSNAVSTKGLGTAISAGMANATATYMGVSGSASVTIR